ncbi:DUF3127 domain-containing protein [Nafulsella turpanensis]|uniref:DUF3127 domain-containing protein n=1 Tax=Nafulsella turpanensis TaxID=1265690 RepID=UPI00034D5933|nr:DUF3127 domain-containing protein [Nafulsella turpanensis]
MNLKGTIKEIFDTQQISDRFSKREFVVEYVDNPQYPQYVKFEMTQDKCDLLDQYKVGDEVDVQFNVRGRAWTNPQGQTQYFNTLQAWRLDVASSSDGAPAPAAAGISAASANSAPAQPSWMTAEDKDRAGGSSFSSEEEDDLPF